MKLWLTAGRVWALPASTMSVAFGALLAVTIGEAPFDFLLFLLSFVGMALLQVAANMLNDVYDYRNGIDKQVNPASGAVVRRWITPRQALIGGATCLLIGSAFGLYIVSRIGLPILLLGVIGVLCAVLYTWGPWPLKYHALGDLAVCLDFGVLGSLGAWTVQTGSMSVVPGLWALPIGMLVAGILHANNWRDISGDREARIRTVASLLGDRGSHVYYAFLLLGAFGIVLALVAVTNLAGLSPAMPASFFVVLIALPLALRLLRRARDRKSPRAPLDFVGLDVATGQLNLVFGLLCVGALGHDAAIQRLF
jgi:1,4-dihydroxy-2-naphthoate octaprenyltransferase